MPDRGLSEIAEGARPRPLGGQGGNAGSRDSRPALPAETDQLIAEAVPAWVGDDGTGHCRGCGIEIDKFDLDCDVCMHALDVIGGEVDE